MCQNILKKVNILKMFLFWTPFHPNDNILHPLVDNMSFTRRLELIHGHNVSLPIDCLFKKKTSKIFIMHFRCANYVTEVES